MLTHRELVARLTGKYDSGEARAIVRLVLENRFGLSWTDVLCGGLQQMGEGTLAELEDIMRRLAAGEPVQYVLGEAEFCGRRFHVEPGVLIPRPETELLCEEMPPLHGQRILDIGTGSGCITVTLALSHPDCKVTGWDISDTALRIAAGNAQSLGATNANFEKTDILSDNFPDCGPFACIVSNPPYICESERGTMEANVLDYEPSLALFVPDDDALRFYRAISRFAVKALMPGGRLLFETNRAYAEDVAEMLRNDGFTDVFVKKDQFDNDRIAGGTR